MVDWAKRVWSTHFPKDRGYEVTVQSPAGPSAGVQLAVRRGGFAASMSIESALDPRRRTAAQWAVRIFGRAESTALVQAERFAHQTVLRGRQVGVATGLAALLAMCWLVVGVHFPLFWLSGLLLVVAALMTTTFCAGVGAWVGEQLAQSRNVRALADVQADPGIDMDRKRWAALTRELTSQRLALRGKTSAPFRALPVARSDSRPVRVNTGRLATAEG